MFMRLPLSRLSRNFVCGLTLLVLVFSQSNIFAQTTKPPQKAKAGAAEAAPDRDDPTARLKAQKEAYGMGDAKFRQHVLAETARHNMRTNKRGHGAEAVAKFAGLSASDPRSNTPVAGPQWLPVGPNNADYEYNGGYEPGAVDSGRARTILPSATDPDTVYFLTAGGGLWKTTNFTSPNTTWTPLTDNLAITGGGAAAFGQSESTIYLGLGDPYDTSLAQGGMTKSTDGGNTWAPIVRLGDAASIRDLKVDSSTTFFPGEVVLVGADNGVWVSTDAGSTYTQRALGGVTGLTVWSIVQTSAGWVASAQPCAIGLSVEIRSLCKTPTTLYLSTDGGNTWNATGSGLVNAGRTTLAVGAPGDATVYAYANDLNENFQGIFKSTDGAATFSLVTAKAAVPTNALTARNFSTGSQTNMDICHTQCWYNQMILVDPSDASRNTVYIGGNLASAKTTTGGASWTLKTWWLPLEYDAPAAALGYVHADMHAAAYQSAGSSPHLLFGTDGGIFLGSADGSTWSSAKNAGLMTHLLYSVAGNAKDPSFAIIGLQDNGTRARVGETGTFNQIIGGDGVSTSVSQANENASLQTVAGGWRPNLSGGLPENELDFFSYSFTRLSGEAVGFYGDNAAPAPALDPTGSLFYMDTNLALYKTTANMGGVQRIAQIGAGGLPAGRAFRSSVLSVGLSPVDLNHIAVAGTGGHVEITTDGGASWADVFLGAAGDGVVGFSSFTTSPVWVDNQTLWVLSLSPAVGVVRVAKGTIPVGGNWASATWTQMQNGLPDLPIYQIIVDPRDITHNTMYAGTFIGVYFTTDGGNNWQPYGTGLPNVNVTQLYMPPDGGFLRVATYGRGVWEIPQLEYVSAAITDDGTSCDSDGALDDGETGHLTVTIHNQGSAAMNSASVSVTSSNSHLTFPSGNTALFPSVPGFGTAVATVPVALAGADGIETADVTMAFSEDGLPLGSPMNVTKTFRVNYDEQAQGTSTETFDAVSNGWTSTDVAAPPKTLTWERKELDPLHFIVHGPNNYSLSFITNTFNEITLTSPIIHVGAGPLQLGLVHRFDTGGIRLDIADTGGNVLYSDDVGASATGVSTNFPSYTNYIVNVPASIANQDVRIRLVANDSWAFGWDVDTITVTGATSNPFTAVVGDAGNCAVNTISFGALSDKTFGDADFTVSATATSTLPVSFGASGACTVTGTTVHITGAGSCTITASQAGNSTYHAATDVPQTFNIAQATPVVTWATPAPIFYGTALSGTQLNATANVAGTFAYNPTAGTVLPVGNQTLSVTFTPSDATDYTTGTGSVGLVVNNGDAVITSPAPGSTLSGSSATFNWTTGTNVVQYLLYVGTAPHTHDIFNSGMTHATSATANGIPVVGGTLYVTLYSFIAGAYHGEDYVYTESGSPQPGVITSPVAGSTLPGASVTFNWTGTGIPYYLLYVGTSPHTHDVYNSGVVRNTTTSATVNGIPTGGATLYVTLYSFINGAYQPADYTYKEAGSPTPAAITSPVPGSTLTGASTTFNWSTGTGVTQYLLYVGTAVHTHDVFASGVTRATTSGVVSGIPTNGATLYVTLYSFINGAWQGTDYTYTESGVPTPPTPATITSPAPGSTLSGSSATLNWTTGSGVTRYLLYVGTTPRAHDVYYLNAGTGTTSASITGIPTNGSTLYVTLFSLINGAWSSGNAVTYTTGP